MTIEELKSNFPDLAHGTEKETEKKEGEMTREQAQMVIGSIIANLSDAFRMKPG